MSKKRILIADDSLIVLKALEMKLNAAGYAVTTASDGSEALEKAAAFRPDLVIMDINFPPDISQGGVAWDGFRIIEWMRHTGAAGAAPAIIITSDEPEKHRVEAIEAGAVAVFQKPLSLPVLLETIEESFTGHTVHPH
jgi:CheY-like chemotaxis protein